MIASLHGTVAQVDEDYLVLVVGDVGYRVFIPLQVRQTIKRGEAVTLHTHLVVREDALTLYGFPTRDQVDIFQLLLKVNGIGPRLALETLSTHSPDVIRRGVVTKDANLFSQVSGIGNKTAQKILLALEDRVAPVESTGQTAGDSPVDMEVQEALVALGYSVIEAQAAIQSIPEETPGELESQLTAALRYFS